MYIHGKKSSILEEQKEAIVAYPSAESKYIIVAQIVIEMTWIRAILKASDVPITTSMLIKNCDNKATIHIANNHVFYECTKYIEVNCHYIFGLV